ncbi:hypothetical protein CHU92_03820 [Flavobacterium cyanobacteriorum]|uniref:Uncharacterized protein n=1 Tax=Flavobacterium cyanobacteriorum TaxID=2022802 RepID=A0A255ZMR8_9FLAO|nr:SprB repeat-containing protein [Flavobacterium cyanobacteriorum]OYQ42813.1 hypothetical protein CHU92_03820 [Flavobacterium cyanobacteriorum]
MVVIYEDPTLTGKFISTFDGYAGVQDNTTAVININGFITLPPPFPVKARLGVGALEGDRGITGDRLQIKANTVATFSNVANTLNPATNYFNSSITNNDTQVSTRTPNGTNTLGLDLDLINLPNPLNSIIPNNETGATLRLITSGDGYGAFLSTFAVEIIEPDINLVKRVYNLSGADITGANVNLGQVLDYVLTFQNIGNDDAKNYTIRDILPINTNFTSVDVSGAPGVTYTYNPATRQILFTIPDNLVEISDPAYSIRIRVQVVNSCSELTDACSNLIQNLAYSTYSGELNTNIISDDPSFYSYDVNCGIGFQGPSNFLVDIDNCTFERTEILCGSSLVLTAGDGYASYEWRNSNGDVIGTTQSITVTSPGQYTVINTPTPPCIGLTEFITVTLFGTNQTNPVLPFADEVAICPNDGEQLPYIFLCGVNDSRLIQTNINNAQSVIWEKLNESSCPAVTVNGCANKNFSCVWNQVGTGTNFNVTTAGQYRLVINYQNGCFNRYYFNVYANLLEAQYMAENITCNTPGTITVTNVPSGYEYQLVSQADNTILVPYQGNPVFSITQAGGYKVQIRQQGVVNGCVFELTDIGILNQNLEVNIIPQNTSCNGLGSIQIQALNVGPQYYYTITGPSNISHGPVTDNNYFFNNLNPGTYSITVTTDEGCTFNGSATILDQNNLSLTASVSQQISCNQGNIQMNPSGGQPPYNFAIYSYNGVLQNPGPDDYQTSVIFDILPGSEGTYQFIVVDSQNCIAYSNPVTIGLVPDVTYTTSITNVTCNGLNNGAILFTLSNTQGFNVSFELLNSAGTAIATSASGNFTNLAPGDYTVNLTQTKGNGSCTFTIPFTITAPPALTVGPATVTQPYNCTTGSATIAINPAAVTGGTAPYQYSINGVTFGNATSFTGLTAGTYTITVKDANGCTASTPAITINTLPQITNITFNATQPSCPALASNVTLTVVGGLAPFTYAITAPAASAVSNGSNNVFTALAPGTYTFTVTDASGCTFSRNYTINPVTAIAVAGQPVSNVTCFGSATGSLTYAVSGFSGSYNYVVRNAANTTVASANNVNAATVAVNSLPAGNYTITVTDTATNCTATATITIQAPSAALSLGTPNVNPITCNAQGSVSATATGGWGGYSYSLLLPGGTTVGPQANGTFSGLTLSGSYTLTVRDANNCTVTANFSLATPDAPTAGIAAASDLCFDANGASITVNVTGGLAPYQYSINGLPAQASNTFANLPPGAYTITVTDANNCTATVSRTISQQLTATATLVKNLDCTASPNAQIAIAITGGAAPYTYQVSFNGGTFGAPQAVAGTTVNYTVAPAAAGTYQFRINGDGGCTVLTQTITIPPLTQPAITSVTQTQNILCNGENTSAIDVVIDTTTGAAPYTLSVVNTTTGVNYGTQTSGLTAGTYQIRVTDSNACQSAVSTITINQPAAISYDVAIVDITCTPTGTSLGQIIVQNVSGGTAGYTYYVTSNFGFNETHVAPAGGNHSFTILNYGIYNVEVIDANGCSVTRNNIIIASPPQDLTIDVNAITTDCITGGTAQVTVTATVLSGNYEFGILTQSTPPYLNPADYQPADPGTPETSTFTGLVPGVTYTFVVHDLVTNCYYFKQADQPISSPSGITATLNTVNNVTCTGAADGNVAITITGYDPGATQINYQVYQAQSNTPTAVTGSVAVSGASVNASVGPLAPGLYYILFTEVGGADAGCSNSSPSFTIMQSTNLLQVTAVVTKNDNCNTNAGRITATGQFGTAPYQYQAVPAGSAPVAANWGTANVFSLEGGNYDIYVRDAYNCVRFTPVTLPTDVQPVIAASVAAQCTSAEGSFTITITRTQNGIAPYTYSFNGGAFQPQASATFAYNNLASGSYTIQVRDANGCGNTVNVQVLAPIFVTPAVAAEPSCANNDGEITVTATGGSGNFTYELQDGSATTIVAAQPTPGFTGLAAGNYIVVIRDTNSNCTAQAPVTLATPTPVTFTADSEDVSCNNGTDGTITITLPAANDNPPYTYAVNDGVNPVISQNSPVFTGLPAGTYTITVTSGKNCKATDTVTISEPSQLTISAAATAFACDANNVPGTSTITITVEDDATSNPSGTAPYTYSIDGTNYFATNTFTVTDNGSTQNLTVYVKDANNCAATTPVTINPLQGLTAVTATQATAITCTNDETVQVSVTGGSGNYTFELLPQGSLPPVTPGAGVSTADFSLAAPGSYTFRVTDNATGCYITTVPYEILPFDTIEVNATAATAVTCFGSTDGSITIDVSGYTGVYTYTVTDASGTIASGNGNTATNPFTITNLPAGSFIVNITATGTPFCPAGSNAITVPSPSETLVLTAAATAPATCTNDRAEIVATAAGGWGTYVYQLVNTTTATTVQAYAANNTFSGLAAGNYAVSVRDAGGCVVTQNITITPATPITANISASATQVLCFGDDTATLSATGVSGGEGVYQYILNTYDTDGITILYSSGAQTTPQFNNLGAGIYSITVTDGWVCDVTTSTVTITEPSPVQGFLSLTDGLSCTTQAELTVSATGGTPPYQYSTDGVNYSSTTVFAVGAGTYQYYFSTRQKT